MKHFPRTGALLLGLALAVSLTACGSRPQGGQPSQSNPPSQSQADGKSLYDHGLEVVNLMAEMARSETYLSLLSPSPEAAALLTDAGQGSFSTPKAVYRITVPISASTAFIAADAGVDLDGLSPTLRTTVENRLLPALLTQINAQAGSTVLMASSICTAQTFFVSDELTENVIYLYTFDGAVPAGVTFIAGEDGAVSASGMLLLNSRFDFSQDFLEYVDALGITVEEVAP